MNTENTNQDQAPDFLKASVSGSTVIIKPFYDWTKKELEALPSREWNQDVNDFDSLIILPTKQLHDSGFRCMDFIAVKDSQPFLRLSGCSDVIHIEGIGGFGEWTPNRGYPEFVVPKGWSVDCLKKSGLLRLFSDGRLKVGVAISSFEVYAVK